MEPCDDPGSGRWGAFWLANPAISRAADYRAALTIPYVPMLLEALFGGLILGFCVAYPLVRRSARIPTKSPVLTSMALSMIALTAVTLLIEVPAKFLTPSVDPVRCFLTGTLFNLIRVLALGAAVGLLYRRRTGPVGHTAGRSRRGDEVSGRAQVVVSRCCDDDLSRPGIRAVRGL